MLAEDSVVEPDVLVGHRTKLTEKCLEGAPELAAWQLDANKRFEQVADVAGEEEFQTTPPYPVTVSPAALVR